MIRPELAAKLSPWREVIAALAFVAFGLWVFSRGGLILQPLGLVIAGVSLVWALNARRQMRFRRRISAPGLVEIDEGAIRYLGAFAPGGELPLRDLVEIRLIQLAGRSHWRLKSADGQALLIPVDAAGADHLGEAFAALPGADMGRISAALQGNRATIQTVWTRPDRGRA